MPEDRHDQDDPAGPTDVEAEPGLGDPSPTDVEAGSGPSGPAGTGSEAGPSDREGRAGTSSEAGPASGDQDLGREPPIDGSAARPHDPLEADERGPTYEASRAQRGAALVVAGGLVLLIAGTVMRLSAGRCILPRTTALGTTCGGVVAEPWFGVLALVTVGAAAVGTVLAIRDLTSGQRPP